MWQQKKIFKRNQTNLLRLKLQIAEALIAAPVANRKFLSDDEDQISAVKRSK